MFYGAFGSRRKLRDWLLSCLQALRTLKKEHITEVKSMKSPPAAVKLTMEAVCIMKQIPPLKVPSADRRSKVDDYWEPAKKMMNEPKFLQSLVDYDKDNVPPAVIERIRSYVANPDFEPEVVKKSSTAAFGLCCWVRAMEIYDRVAKLVAPKKVALKQAEDEFGRVNELLQQKKAALDEVESRIQSLQNQFQATNDRKEDLQRQVDECTKKLDRARRLIGGLGGEQQRWSTMSADLAGVLTNLTGDVLISAAVISYLGPFTATYRERAVSSWVQAVAEAGLVCSSPFSLRTTLGDEVAIRQWNIQGLPNDAFSIESAVVIQHSRRWPLLIDPQMQARNAPGQRRCVAEHTDFSLPRCLSLGRGQGWGHLRRREERLNVR
eukprot:2815180-Pleurochrysis_carterae.AAC.4